MKPDPYNMNKDEPRDLSVGAQLRRYYGAGGHLETNTTNPALRSRELASGYGAGVAAAAAANATEAAAARDPRVSRPTDVQRSLVVEPPADLAVERSDKRVRKNGARSAFAPASAAAALQTTAPAGEFVGPPRQPGIARKDVGGVFQNRAVVNGVEQNVYSDSGFDPLFNGVTTTTDAMARSKADPEFAAQYGAYGADRIRGQAQIAEAEAAAAAQAYELTQQRLTGERGETQSDILKAQSEAAKNLATAGKAQAEAGRIGVETDIADADATNRGSDRLNAIAADVEKEAAARFAADPSSARTRWGSSVDPRTAVDLAVMERLVQLGVDPRQTRAGKAGLAALEQMLNAGIDGGTTHELNRVLTDQDWALNDKAGYVPLEAVTFGDRGVGAALADWTAPDFIESSPLYKNLFKDFRNTYRVSAGGSTPTTFFPEGEGLRRENLEPLIESIRRLGQPRQ